MKFLALLLLIPAIAFGQSVPNPSNPIVQGSTWTPPQWINAWQLKTDYPVPCSALPSFSGAITTSGCVASLAVVVGVANGGTGVSTITGVLKGNGSSSFSVAIAADIYALWSGGCSTLTYLRGDGVCATPPGLGTAPNNTVMGNSSGGSSVPIPETNPTILGLNEATQTLQLGATSGNPLPFGLGNSLFYSNGASGGITLQGFATKPGNDIMISPFDIYIASDTVDTSHTLGNNTGMNWFSVEGHASAGHIGGRAAINARCFIDGAPGGLTNAAYSCITGVTSVNVNMGGTGGAYGNYLGSVYGGNENVFTQSGATFLNQITGEEKDVALSLGSSAAEKHGFNIVQTATDSLRGVYDDSAIGFTMQDRWNATCTTSPLSLGATGCTLVAGSGMTAGDYVINFHNSVQDIRYIACTGADPNLICTWAPGLTSATTLIKGFDLGNMAPWRYGIDFASYAHYSPFYKSLTATDSNVFQGSTLIAYTNRVAGGAQVPTADGGMDFHNVVFTSFSLDLPGLFVDPAGNTQVTSLTLTPVTIAGLPTCNGGTSGEYSTVSNGVASPTYMAVVSTTGSTPDPVFCNGTNWVYH